METELEKGRERENERGMDRWTAKICDLKTSIMTRKPVRD